MEHGLPFTIMALFGLGISYNVYRGFNPTIDDLRHKKEREERSYKFNLEVAKIFQDNYEWEERCLKEGKILPK
jgi:hypothetical protein